MKKLLLLIILLAPLAVWAQKTKIEVEDGKIYMNDSFYARVEKDGNDYTVKNKAKETIIIFKLKHDKSLKEVNSSNPDGIFSYYDIVFTKSKQAAQTDEQMSSKKVGKLVIKYELIKNKDINQDAVDNFVLLYPVRH